MKWIKIILKTIIVILLQVTLFDRLHIQGWGYPMVYILLLFSMPLLYPQWLEMIIGAIIGLIMDIFCNSLGVHIAACVALTYLRPIILKKLVQDIERIKTDINSKSIGIGAYVKYITLLTFCHHFMIFGLEAWNFQNWDLILIQTACSSVLTILLLLIYNLVRK